jgi:hypothetical protein
MGETIKEYHDLSGPGFFLGLLFFIPFEFIILESSPNSLIEFFMKACQEPGWNSII